MTAGHRHHNLKIERDSRLYRLLRKQWVFSTDLAYVERSRFVWGPAPEPERYGLSLLGLLHPLTGLTLEVD